MSERDSNCSNDGESGVNNSEVDRCGAEVGDAQTLNAESKMQAPSNFGRPRKHPYKPGKYKCDYCEVLCSKPSVLKKHLRAHTNERPYPCSDCKRSFKTKSNLSKHMKSKSHSLKIPSSKEKASMMLKALSGVDSESFKAGSMDNIEYDCMEKEVAVDNSPASSCDDRSVLSEDNSAAESSKRVANSEHSHGNGEDAPENELSSCSGMLTINSQSGPITVEVEIKLETMKQLQHGLSNMTIKRFSPSPSHTPLMSRNDADVRAAESILHMANQRQLEKYTVPPVDTLPSPVNIETKLVVPKEENRRSESTESSELTCPSTRGYVEQQNLPMKPSTKGSSLAYSSKPIGRSRASNKLIPSEDQKKMKKCLMENLLKKMQRNTDRSSRQAESARIGPGGRQYSNNSTSENEPDSSSMVSRLLTSKKTHLNVPHVKFNKLIPESSSMQSYVSVSSSSAKQAMVLKRTVPSTCHVTNCPTSLPSNSAIYLLSSFPDSKPSPKRLNSPISSTGFKVDSTTDTLPTAVNKPQRVYQQQLLSSNNNQTLITQSTQSDTLFHSVKEESTIPQRLEPDVHSTSTLNAAIADEIEQQSMADDQSVPISQGSETGSSPRLCIVEESIEPDPSIGNNSKRNVESDEEIDVVNTDSEDNESSMKRMAERGGGTSVTKKRKGVRDVDGDGADTETKRLKETVALHAPNINAKDLVQDCPLNLSANRAPVIPAGAQTASVLESLYRPMVTVAGSVSTTTAAAGTVAALTNTHPAHPGPPTDHAGVGAPAAVGHGVSSNGGVGHLSQRQHPRDYPIFEDKVRCEDCAQMLEPSRLQLHRSAHIFTEGKDVQTIGGQAEVGGGGGAAKPRTYRCVVCNTGFRVMGHLSKHHKSKSHLQGLVNSGLLSKALNAKIEESKVPIAEVIDQKTGNIIPDVLSRYLSDWSQPSTDADMS